MVYFYNFLLGVWQYICTYCVDNGVGADTYIAITEDAGKNKGRKVKNGIGMQGYKDIEISYSTEQEIPKTLEGFKSVYICTNMSLQTIENIFEIDYLC